MIDLREPRFGWGQKVRPLVDLVNDGSHPGAAPDAVLAVAGAVGEIVNIGHHADSNTPVYLVEFDGRTVVGCVEDELEAV